MDGINWLKKAADAYNTFMCYDYIFHLGTRKRKIIISIVTANAEEFTHVSGLDHITDIDALAAKNAAQKKRIFKNILDEKITYADITDSSHLHESFGDERFTIDRRIKDMADLISHVEKDSRNGTFYRWNKGKSRTRSRIEADYVLSIPIGRDVSIHMFLKQSNKTAPKDEPIRLFMISMFAALNNYTAGQENFGTILALVRNKVEKGKVIESVNMYCRESYREDLEVSQNAGIPALAAAK